MKPPIIVSDPGDIAIFRSVQDAERCLETPDVKEGRLKIYDSEGRLLSLEAESEPDEPFLGLKSFMRGVDIGIVRIGREESPQTHGDELRQILVEFLIAIGANQESLWGTTLEDALAQVIARQGYRT
jgi:hypothetical protein